MSTVKPNWMLGVFLVFFKHWITFAYAMWWVLMSFTNWYSCNRQTRRANWQRYTDELCVQLWLCLHYSHGEDDFCGLTNGKYCFRNRFWKITKRHRSLHQLKKLCNSTTKNGLSCPLVMTYHLVFPVSAWAEPAEFSISIRDLTFRAIKRTSSN